MKKLLLLLVAFSLALAGCVKVEMTSEIDKNGGGTYRFSYTVSEEVEQALKELGEMDSDMGEVPPIFDLDRKEFEKTLEGTGSKLIDYSDEVVDGLHTVSLAIQFTDINTLTNSVGGLMGEEGDGMGGFGVVRHGDDYLLHSIEPVASEEAMEEMDEEESMESMEDLNKAMENAQKSMALMGKLMAHANELSFLMSITFPSDVLEHNAHRLEGRTCIWEINSENMMTAQGMEPRVVFKGAGVKIKTAD
jgi:hypothetical protein